LTAIPGVRPLFSAPFFHEFALSVPGDPERLNAWLLARGFLGGFPLGRVVTAPVGQAAPVGRVASAQSPAPIGRMAPASARALRSGWLVCVTEANPRSEVDAFAAAVREALAAGAAGPSGAAGEL